LDYFGIWKFQMFFLYLHKTITFMPTAKNRPGQKQKAAQFSEEQKKRVRAAQAGEKTHLIPDVEWQSADFLELRGDVAEAIQNNLMAAYEALQRAGQAFQVVLNMSIQKGSAKLKYSWNNGEPASEEDIKEFQAQMELINKQRTEQLQKVQDVIAKEKGEPKTDLVTVDGAPLTEGNLDKAKNIIV
jgi:hypothetical protein